MSRSFDRDDHSMGYSGNSLPQVDRSKTTWNHRKSNLRRRDDMDRSSFTRRDQLSPEDICVDISSFNDRPKTRSRKKTTDYHSTDDSDDEQFSGHHVVIDLQTNDVSHSSHMTENGVQVKNHFQDMTNNKGVKTDKHRTSFMHLLLAEDIPDSVPSSDFLADSNRRREPGFRRRQAFTQNIEEKRLSLVQTGPNYRNMVPRLNLPPDIGIERENTLIGLSRTPGTPEDTYRSHRSTDRRLDAFGKNPKEVSDPLEEIIGHPPVSERKYSILPSIGTPIMMRKPKGNNSHRNQLDYTRDRCESDAAFFSDYNGNINSPEIVSNLTPVPLPPIQKNSNAWNSPKSENKNSFAEATENPSDREQDTPSPKIPFSVNQVLS